MAYRNGWLERGRDSVREMASRGRRLPRWALKWGISLLMILFLLEGTHLALGMLQNPGARTMQTMMHPSGLTGPVAVSAQPAVRRDLVRSVTYPGSVAPDEDIPIYARVEGWVLSLGPREGDVVRAGEVLARLDTTQLAPEVAQHRFAVAAAQAGYEQQQIAIGQAESAYEHDEAAVAQANANLADAQAKQSYWASEFQRDQILYQHGVISASAFDQAQQAYRSAQAGVAAAQEKIVAERAAALAAHAQIARSARLAQAGAAQMQAQQAALAQMETTFGYATVVAPESGIVTARTADPGVLVKPGQPLLKMARMTEVRVRVQVAQEDAAAVRLGTPAMIQFEGMTDPVRTHVTRIFPQNTPQTRTTTVEMLIPNPGERIKLDTYASVTLDLAVHKNAIVIPRSAVLSGENGQPTVFVVNGTSAQARQVTEGLVQSDWVEILQGIKPGEMVITDGNRGLVDGQAVTVTTF